MFQEVFACSSTRSILYIAVHISIKKHRFSHLWIYNYSYITDVLQNQTLDRKEISNYIEFEEIFMLNDKVQSIPKVVYYHV